MEVAFRPDGMCPSCHCNRSAPPDKTAPSAAPRRSSIPVRPVAVTVIAWYLIIAAGLALVSSLAYLNNPLTKDLMARSPLPESVQYLLLFGGLAVSLVSGIGMLQGHNWARWVYVIWAAVGFAISLATSPLKLMLIPGILVYFIIVLFLFRPAATRFFVAEGTPNERCR